VSQLPAVCSGISAALGRAEAEGAMLQVGACPPPDMDPLQKPVGLFYDLNAWEAQLLECREAFGEGFLHALALKSNGLGPMLNWAKEQGFGTECASIGELAYAQRLGFRGHYVVFDSPVKTYGEIKLALETGAHINIDNFQELELVDKVRSSLPAASSSDVGLRINPLVGAGEIAALSVSTSESKFGIPADRLDEIVDAYQRHSWLNSIHVHVGSGGMGVKVLTAGVKKATELALEINARLGRCQVDVLDMGGGMPVNYKSESWESEKVPSFHAYAAALRSEVPMLFPENPGSPFRRVVTEFGQSLNAKSGWLASRIEYTKPASNDGQIVLIHFGADMCVRQCYTKEHERRLEFYDAQGVQLSEPSTDRPLAKVHVAGPLCFQGDFLTHDAEAPRLQQGDIVVLRDAGANTMSLFSRHCMRQVPAAYGYRTTVDEKGKVEITDWQVLKKAEDLEGGSRHWGLCD